MKKIKFVAGLLTAALLVPSLPIKSNALIVGYTLDCLTDTVRRHVEHYDVDHDGCFDQDELMSITTLDLSGDADVGYDELEDIHYFPYVRKIDISDCPNIYSLTLDGNNCESGSNYGYLELDAHNSGLKFITLNNCNSLKKLKLENTNLSYISLANCPNLETLYIEGTNVNKLYLGVCPSLSQLVQNTTVDQSDPSYDYYSGSGTAELSCNPGCVITAVLPENCLNIDEATFPDSVARNYINQWLDSNSDGYLSVNEINNAEEIYCNTLDCLRYFPNVKTVHIPDYQGSTLDLNNYSGIEFLYTTSGDFKTLNLSGLSNLKGLYLTGDHNLQSVILPINSNIQKVNISSCSSLTNLDFSKLPKVINISVDCSPLSSIDVSNCSQLDKITLHDTNISTLDISMLPNIHYVELYRNTGMTELNIGYNTNLLNVYVDKRWTNCFRDGSTNEIVRWQYSVSWDDFSSCLIFDANMTIDTVKHPKPTPVPTGTPTGNPTVAPTTVPTNRPTTAPTQVPSQTPVSESGVSGFVERLYTIALDRASDPNGKADWVNRVYTAGATGADVAQGFLFSPEFLGKDMSNEEFLGVLYRVFFDRVGDQGGVDYWLGQMAGGMDKQTVIWGFINSTEWANVCLRFGIASGGNGVPNITIEPSPEIIEFATRLYTTCLGRNADQNGLMDWATQLANRQISGSQAAAGFFTSSEFVNANYENAEYINRLYRTFMGREADQGGFDYWMGRFAEGATREDVFNGFAGSTEWAEICSSYGILK